MRNYEISDEGPIYFAGRYVPFDVDDTLVTPNPELAGHAEAIYFGSKGREQPFYVLKEHVKALKEFASRDFFIHVWSDGGAPWAREVVEALGLKNFVDLVTDKPLWYFDDKEANNWAMKRVYKVVTPEFKKAAEEIIAKHADLLTDLAKGPPCNDPACPDCNKGDEDV